MHNSEINYALKSLKNYIFSQKKFKKISSNTFVNASLPSNMFAHTSTLSNSFAWAASSLHCRDAR